ncbi:MAG TPA: hypothetical protein PLO37_15605 [Candidatus Hydrogenedentes bacterium]|nr:hypothetical protein [Candidatus Hydrogenedentota bacterium]HPG68272.1 hypothetical protein [Candidatus Hydrogenedentota bacterium]
MDDFEKRINRAAQSTWQAIGGDILRAAEVNSVSRDEVVEAVMDYLEGYGRDMNAIAEFRKLGFEEKQAMLLKAFPLARYGW